MSKENQNVSEPAKRELTLTRIINAPLQLVWKAWTDPKQIALWWGPKGFTNPRCEWEAKPNGKIYIDMKAPDGFIHGMDGEFIEIVELTKLVFIAAALDDDGKRIFENLNTVIFTEENGKTKLTMSVVSTYTRPEATQYLDGMTEGWNQSIDRLNELAVKENDTSDRQMVITRLINAPRELVWEAWTKPEHVKHWWGPNGFTNTIHEMEVKPGGVWRFIMHGPNGMDFPNKIVFNEVVKPGKLIYTHSSEDINHPNLFQTTVTFQNQGDKTYITMKAVFATAEELNRVVKEYGALEGGKQTLARLDEYVTNQMNTHS